MSNHAIETTPMEEIIVCTSISDKVLNRQIRWENSLIHRCIQFVSDIFYEVR